MKMNLKKIVIISVIVIAATIIFKSFLIMLLLIAISAISTFYKRWLTLDLDFELYTFSALVAGTVYGPAAGFFVGAAGAFIGMVINLQLFRNVIFTAIRAVSVALIGLFAGYVSLQFIIVYAMLMTLFLDLVFCVLAGSMGGNPANLGIYMITHALIVYGLLRAFFHPVVSVIG